MFCALDRRPGTGVCCSSRARDRAYDRGPPAPPWAAGPPTQLEPGGIARHRLPDSIVRLQVRTGFGKMPAFGERVISDDELDAVIAYLGELRAWRRSP